MPDRCEFADSTRSTRCRAWIVCAGLFICSIGWAGECVAGPDRLFADGFRPAAVEEEGPVCIGPECGDPSAVASELTNEQLRESFDVQDSRQDSMGPDDHERAERAAGRWELGVEGTDNVPAISDELALRLDRRSDQALRSDLSFSYAPAGLTPSSMAANARFQPPAGQMRWNLDLSRTDYRRLNAYDGQTVRLSPVWKWSHRSGRWQFKPWITRMDLGGEPYLRGVGADLSLLRPQNRRWLGEVRLQARQMEFLQETASPLEDRDGREWKIGITEYFRPPRRERGAVTFGVGLEMTWREAKGDDYDATSAGGFGFARIDPHPRWNISGTFSFLHRDHRNPNHRDPLGRSRDDQLRTWNLRGEYRLSRSRERPRSLFLSYLDRWNRSNLDSLFGYRSRTVAGGLLFEF